MDKSTDATASRASSDDRCEGRAPGPVSLKGSVQDIGGQAVHNNRRSREIGLVDLRPQDGHDEHASSDCRSHANLAVLNGHTATRINAELMGGLQIDVRRRLSIRHIVASNNDIEEIRYERL